MSDKQQCCYGDSVYSHDSDICTVDKCLRCNDGEWKELDASACCWESPFRRQFKS